MAYTTRAGQSVGGPGGQASTWACMDETVNVALQAAVTTPILAAIEVITQPELSLAGGAAAPDFLYTPGATTGIPIARLVRGQINNIGAALRAADATVAMGLAVFRAGALVGGNLAFGWLATGALSSTVLGVAGVPLGNVGGSTGTPAFALGTTVQMPAIASNTALSPAAAGPQSMLLQPGDTIVFLQAATAGAALPQFAVAAGIV